MMTTSRHPHNRHRISHDPLGRPAMLLLGAAALSLTLTIAGTFKPAEAGAIAATTTGGAIACLLLDRDRRDR